MDDFLSWGDGWKDPFGTFGTEDDPVVVPPPPPPPEAGTEDCANHSTDSLTDFYGSNGLENQEAVPQEDFELDLDDILHDYNNSQTLDLAATATATAGSYEPQDIPTMKTPTKVTQFQTEDDDDDLLIVNEIIYTPSPPRRRPRLSSSYSSASASPVKSPRRPPISSDDPPPSSPQKHWKPPAGGESKSEQAENLSHLISDLYIELQTLFIFQSRALSANQGVIEEMRRTVHPPPTFSKTMSELKKKFSHPHLQVPVESGYLAPPPADLVGLTLEPRSPKLPFTVSKGGTKEWKPFELHKLNLCVYKAYYHRERFLLESRFQQMLIDMGFTSDHLLQVHNLSKDIEKELFQILQMNIKPGEPKTKRRERYSSTLQRHFTQELELINTAVKTAAEGVNIKTKFKLGPRSKPQDSTTTSLPGVQVHMDLDDAINWKQHEIKLISWKQFHATKVLDLDKVDWDMVAKDIAALTRRTSSGKDLRNVFKYNLSLEYNSGSAMPASELSKLKELTKGRDPANIDWEIIAQKMGTGRSAIRIFQTYRSFVYSRKPNTFVLPFMDTYERRREAFIDITKCCGHTARSVNRLSEKYGDFPFHSFRSCWQQINPGLAQGNYLPVEDAALLTVMEMFRTPLLAGQKWGIMQRKLPWRHCHVWRKRAQHLFKNADNWSLDEDRVLMFAVEKRGVSWAGLEKLLNRTRSACLNRYTLLKEKLQGITLAQYHSIYDRRLPATYAQASWFRKVLRKLRKALRKSETATGSALTTYTSTSLDMPDIFEEDGDSNNDDQAEDTAPNPPPSSSPPSTCLDMPNIFEENDNSNDDTSNPTSPPPALDMPNLFEDNDDDDKADDTSNPTPPPPSLDMPNIFEENDNSNDDNNDDTLSRTPHPSSLDMPNIFEENSYNNDDQVEDTASNSPPPPPSLENDDNSDDQAGDTAPNLPPSPSSPHKNNAKPAKKGKSRKKPDLIPSKWDKSQVEELLDAVKSNEDPPHESNYQLEFKTPLPSEVFTCLKEFDPKWISAAIDRLTSHMKKKNMRVERGDDDEVVSSNSKQPETTPIAKLFENCNRRRFDPFNPVSVASALQLRRVELKPVTKTLWASLTEFERTVAQAYGSFDCAWKTKLKSERPCLPTASALAFLSSVKNLLKSPKAIDLRNPEVKQQLIQFSNGLTNVDTDTDDTTTSTPLDSKNVKNSENPLAVMLFAFTEDEKESGPSGVQVVKPTLSTIETCKSLHRHAFNIKSETKKVRGTKKAVQKKAMTRAAAKARWQKKREQDKEKEKETVDEPIELIELEEPKEVPEPVPEIKINPRIQKGKNKNKKDRGPKPWHDSMLCSRFGAIYQGGYDEVLVSEAGLTDEALFCKYETLGGSSGGPEYLNVLHDHSYDKGHASRVFHVVSDIKNTLELLVMKEKEDIGKENKETGAGKSCPEYVIKDISTTTTISTSVTAVAVIRKDVETEMD